MTAVFNRGLEIKTPQQITVMREAGLIVGETLALLHNSAVAGMTTADLNRIADEHIRSRGATSNFLGYYGFSGVICTSINDQVVHGIPGERTLADGDVISIDCGAIVDGWHGDAATTIAIGEVSEDVAELLRVTEESMWRGIGAAQAGGRVGDISNAVETYIDSQGDYGIVEGFTGHGIGSAMHMPPDVPNFGRAGRGPKLNEGLALAVEPMVTLGSASTHTLADGWTEVTDDGSWAAHFENTFALTEHGVWALTALDGGKQKFAELGIPFGGS